MSIRLINTSTLRLASFLGDQTPNYAILSHTWKHGEEISFQDMLSISENPHHPAIQRSGYEKIVKICQQARNDGIAYAWVDTCCMDKTSSAELSENINSMYQWYRRAEICYAYLPDYDITSAASCEIALPNCRWFTRGWCLQELIAPSRLEFLDAQWSRIGSRAEMTALISKITGIDEGVLLDSRLVDSVPVARRMSWAAGRETTREEDLAYCLLGIFGVNMPMLYGEGTKAFTRLQEEIIKISNDLSIFAFKPTSRNSDLESTQPYCHLLASCPTDFIGCRGLVHARVNSHWNNAFALTNKGLHFQRVELHADARHGLYSILLNCEISESQPARLYVRKVGPGLYAKYDEHCIDSLPSSPDFKICPNDHAYVEQDVYIIRNVSPSVRVQISRAEEYAIHVRSRSDFSHGAFQFLQRVATSDRWDASRMQFLTKGEPSIRGFWKVFPSLALARKATTAPGPATGQVVDDVEDLNIPSAHFYLVCGLEHRCSESPAAEPRAWVRLFTLEEWRALEKRWGIITNMVDVAGLGDSGTSCDQLLLGTNPKNMTRVVAVIRLVDDGRPKYELEINFENVDKEVASRLVS